jgi:hypothetical protein
MEMSVETRVDQSEIAERTSKQGEIQGRMAFSDSLAHQLKDDDFSGIFLLLKTACKSVAQNPNHGPNGPSIKYKIKWTGISLFPSQHLINTVMMPRSRTYRTSQNRATRSGRAEDEAGWHDCARCCSFTLVL